jgi:aminoglycoside phosphotransferase (APT) family kinase protein
VTDKQNPSPEWIAQLRRRFPVETYVDRALTRKLLKRTGGPGGAQELSRVATNLRAFLKDRISEPFTISEIWPLTGGSSKEQFSFVLRRADETGNMPGERLVLRLQPSASIVETHRLREFEALRALRTVLPVPAAHWVDPEGEYFGEPALICTFCEGVARTPVEGLITTSTAGFGPLDRTLLTPVFIDNLARLHKFDWTQSDLASLDVPRAGSNEGVIWAINWWERVWEEDSLEPMPFMTMASDWLRRNAPVIDRVSLVHGDYKAGNFLFKPGTGQVTAVLDWELVHLGDRHEDVGFALLPICAEVDASGTTLVCGLCTAEHFLAEYEKRTEMSIDPVRLHYYQVFTAWRSAIICGASAPRCALGQKTHIDALLCWSAYALAPVLSSLLPLLRDRM